MPTIEVTEAQAEAFASGKPIRKEAHPKANKNFVAILPNYGAVAIIRYDGEGVPFKYRFVVWDIVNGVPSLDGGNDWVDGLAQDEETSWVNYDLHELPAGV